MHNYLVNTEMARITIMLGIVISILIYRRTGRTLGGVIIPGYLALFIGQPSNIIITLAIASLAYYIVHIYIKPRYLLAGRRLFEVEILVALIIQLSWNFTFAYLGRDNSNLLPFFGIGYVLPGVIAHDMGRQGLRRTLTSTVLGILIVAAIIVPLAAIEAALPKSLVVITSPLLRTQPYPYAYMKGLLPIGIVISVLVSLLAYNRYRVRTGGFVTAAYLALFAIRPLDLIFVVVGSILTYLFVTYFLKNNIILFGRTKLGVMILVGVVVSWAMEIAVINLTNGEYAPWSGFVIIMPMIVSLIATDFDRQGPIRTTGATLVSASIVLVLMVGLSFLVRQYDLTFNDLIAVRRLFYG